MRVILATDGTKFSNAAVDMLGKLNLGEGDVVNILCIVDMALPMAIDIYGGYLPDTSQIESSARENAEKIIDKAKATLYAAFDEAKVEITGEVLFGSPESRIVETAEETHADLIVIGSHGHKQWARLLLGSVSNSVVHHAHCSVLVVRADVE